MPSKFFEGQLQFDSLKSNNVTSKKVIGDSNNNSNNTTAGNDTCKGNAMNDNKTKLVPKKCFDITHHVKELHGE
jgi:hypothetical protein